MSRTSPSAPWNFYFMVAGVKVGVEDSGPPCRPKGSSRLTLQLRRAAPKACASIDELRRERKNVAQRLSDEKTDEKLKQLGKDIADKMQKIS